MTTQTKTIWQKVKLEEVLFSLIDHRGKTPKKLGGDWSLHGIPAISAKNIKNGQIVNEGGIRYVNQKLYDKWMPEKLEKGDILLTSEAPLGELLYLKEKVDFCLSQRLFALRTQPQKLNSRFLYYYLLSPIGRHQLLRRISGTAAEGIRQAELRQLDVAFPENADIQKRIADILSAFDDKIELNNKISKNLEATAQAIFKEWFIEKEKLKVKNEKLGNLVDISYGRGPSSNQLKKAGYPVYGANGVIGYFDSYSFSDRQIIVGCRGVVGNVTLTLPQCLVTHNSLVITPRNNKKIFFYYLLKNQNLDAVVGGSAQPQITINDLEKLDLIVPEEKLQDEFESVIGNIEQKRLTLFYENQKLAALRDLLLPKLMSGNIKV